MSKKIELGIEGRLRSKLKPLFKTYVSKKMEESSRKMSYYLSFFPFLEDWVVDEEEAELILRYYGYLDKNGNIILDPKESKGSSNKRIDYLDDEDYWDDYEEIYPGSSDEFWGRLECGSRRRSKKGKYKHYKRKKRMDSYDEDMFDVSRPYTQGYLDETELPDEECSNVQCIWFYFDYHDKTDKLEFNRLKDFNDFCERNDFLVPPYVGERIASRAVSHVCLNPGAKERGVDEIMGAESYADMFYEAGEELQISYR